LLLIDIYRRVALAAAAGGKIKGCAALKGNSTASFEVFLALSGVGLFDGQNAPTPPHPAYSVVGFQKLFLIIDNGPLSTLTLFYLSSVTKWRNLTKRRNVVITLKISVPLG